MSTRGMFQFRDGGNAEVHSVYSHYDCYPEGAAEQLRKALVFAWKEPRFEADEFAAAFVAANKPAVGGNIRLVPSNEEGAYLRFGALEWRYMVEPGRKGLVVKVYALPGPANLVATVDLATFVKGGWVHATAQDVQLG